MPVLTGEKVTRALRAGGFKGMIVGMTGDPSGCTERDDFEASGLNLCVDKVRGRRCPPHSVCYAGVPPGRE